MNLEDTADFFKKIGKVVEWNVYQVQAVSWYKKKQLEKELKEVSNQEMWQAGKVLRNLRPENL